MNKFLMIGAMVICTSTLHAQEYLGLSTGNFSGLHGIMLQPANVADNRFQFDINLISTSLNFSNNYLGISRNFFTNNFFSFKKYENFSDFRNRELTKESNPDPSIFLKVSNRINLPSLLLSTGKNSGIALNIQSRTGLSVDNLDPLLAEQLYEEWKYPATYNQNYNTSGLDVNGLNWLEIGLTYGRVLVNHDKHFLKAGVTAKYLGGISSFYFNSNNLNVRAENDSIFYIQSDEINYSRSATNISAGFNSSFRPDASAFGFDLGLVYEFRGRIDNFKFIKQDKDEEYLKVAQRRDKNKYTFKIGLSLLDVGSFNFQPAPDARNFSINDQININTIQLKNMEDFDALIAEHGTYTGEAKSFTVAMPTAFSAQLDLHLYRGFYINGMVYRPVSAFNNNADFRVYTPNYVAVTPRWESRVAGVYVPFVLNSRNELSAGATIRLGPVFVGTSNMLTLVQKDNIKKADVHAGLKIPIAFGRPSKTRLWFKGLTQNREITEQGYSAEQYAPLPPAADMMADTNIKRKPVIQPAPAPAPPPANQPINIIINNYNAPGSTVPASTQTYNVQPGVKNDTVFIQPPPQPAPQPENLDDIQLQIDRLKKQLEQKKATLQEVQMQQQNQTIPPDEQEGTKKKMTH